MHISYDVHGLLMSQEPSTIDVKLMFILCFEILFIRFDVHDVLCADDGIVIADRSTLGDGDKKL